MKTASKTRVSNIISKLARKGLAFGTAASMFLTIGAWQVPAQKDFASDPKNGERLVGVTIGVLGMATGPGAPAALAAAKIMKDMMSALGFFKSSDPVAEAITSINQRLDAANVRMDMIENAIRALGNKVFENANLERIRELRAHRNEVERVVSDLKRKDPNKDGLILRARQTADALLEDKDLWLYSDLTVKDQFVPVFNSTTGLNELKLSVKSGTMLEPEFKTIPTLEVYASAISAWVAAIEYAGNPGQVNALYGQNIQRHIDNLSVRPNFDETSSRGLTLPEQLKQQIQGFYTPTTTRPDAALMCNFSEYVEDGFSREIKFVKTYEYRVGAANSLCSVPPGLTKQATVPEEDLEKAYGMEVIDTLAQALTRLKRNGTVREQFIGTFNSNFKADDFNILYTVSQDGTLTWHRHMINYSGGNKNAVHSFNPPKVIGSGWSSGVRDVMHAGLLGIYSLREDGDLQWFWHDGFSDGSAKFRGGSNYVTTKNMQGFHQVIAQDEGVMYGRLHPNDPGIMWGITANYNNKGMPKTSFAMRLTAQTINFAAYKKIFAGGKGVLYGISHDGKLHWMKHYLYLNPVPAEYQNMQGLPGGQGQYQLWLQQWSRPVEILAGVGDVKHAFSPGEGHLYFVLNDGSLAYTRHGAWNTSTGRVSPQFLPTIDKPVPIAGGWGSYKFAFARITTSDAGSGIRGLDIIVN